MAVLAGRTALGCADNCGAAVRVGAWLRAQRRPGLARLCARPLSAPQETIRRDVSGRCVRGALVLYSILSISRDPKNLQISKRHCVKTAGNWELALKHGFYRKYAGSF